MTASTLRALSQAGPGVTGASLEARVIAALQHVEGTYGGYPHFMMNEIREQPETLRSTLRGRLLEDGLRARPKGG
ncbi:MAG: hypothetical protein ACREMM_02270 [Gemmatimonadales bacterium]